MKIKLLDLETALKVSRAIYPERVEQDDDEALEYLPSELFGRTLENVIFHYSSYCYRDKKDTLWYIPSYFCSHVKGENELRQRYLIHREYFGKFDDDVVIAATESLTEAVFICEELNKVFGERPYNFDFRKVENTVDPALDYVPGEGFLEQGRVIDCFCLQDYRNKMAERKV